MSASRRRVVRARRAERYSVAPGRPWHLDDTDTRRRLRVLARRISGLHITFDAVEHIIDEEHRDHALLGRSTTRTVVIDVVPAVIAEHVRNQRRPQDEAHLLARHALAQLGKHVLIDVITLTDVDPIRVYDSDRGV